MTLAVPAAKTPEGPSSGSGDDIGTPGAHQRRGQDFALFLGFCPQTMKKTKKIPHTHPHFVRLSVIAIVLTDRGFLWCGEGRWARCRLWNIKRGFREEGVRGGSIFWSFLFFGDYLLDEPAGRFPSLWWRHGTVPLTTGSGVAWPLRFETTMVG